MSPLISRSGLTKARLDELGLWLNLLALVALATSSLHGSALLRSLRHLGALCALASLAYAWAVPRLRASKWGLPMLLGLLCYGLAQLSAAWYPSAFAAGVLVLAHALAGAHAAQDDTKLRVTLITGFLGAGKTTLVNRLLQSPAAKDAAVIVNEWGRVSIDHLLVQQVDERMVALPNGCVCCALRGDLVNTIRDLLAQVQKGEIGRFRRVIVETSGLADPAPVLQTLSLEPWLRQNAELTGVVTVVDGQQGLQTLERHPESQRQVAVADLLLVSKIDVATEAQLEQLESKLRSLAPFANLERAASGTIAPERVLEVQHTSAQDLGSERLEAQHTEALDAVSLERNTPIAAEAFDTFLEHIISNRGADLIRVKGFVYVEGKEKGPALIQGVQHYFSPIEWLDHWPEGHRSTRLVFIGASQTVRTLERLWTQTASA